MTFGAKCASPSGINQSGSLGCASVEGGPVALGVGRAGCRAWGARSSQVQVGGLGPSPQGWLSCSSLVGVCGGEYVMGACDGSMCGGSMCGRECVTGSVHSVGCVWWGVCDGSMCGGQRVTGSVCGGSMCGRECVTGSVCDGSV